MADYTWASRLAGMENPAVKNLLKIMQRTDIISFSAGSPAAASFPVEELKTAFQSVLQQEGANALQYGMSEGYPLLREWIAERAKRFGVTCSAGNVLVANGSQQVLDLVARILIDPGDSVIVENPTYLAALQVFKGFQANVIPVQMDKNGMNMDQLEIILRNNKPKFIYVNPTFQNPSGITMCYERRVRLGKIAQAYQVPVIEDNPYGELRFSGEDLPAIKSLVDSPWIMYAGTVSKIIAPGLRVGWLIADETMIDKVATAKQLCDVLNNSLTQRAVHYYVTHNDLESHISRIVKQYRYQRDTMVEAMQKHFPASASWIVPEGGMFIWVTLPEEVNTTRLLPKVIEQAKVAYVPGEPFFADGSGSNTLRLNFSNSTPDLIQQGIARLGDLLKSEMG